MLNPHDAFGQDIRNDKEMAVRGFSLPLAQGLRIEAECFNRSIHEPATREGLRQFRESDHPDRRADPPARTPWIVRGWASCKSGTGSPSAV